MNPKCSLKSNYFDKNLFENIIALFITLLLTPCKQKSVDYVRNNQHLNILKICDFDEFLELNDKKINFWINFKGRLWSE